MTQPAHALRKAFPMISAETERELISRDLVSFPGPGLWRFGDHANGTTRSLTGRKFVRHDNSGPDWHRLSGLEDVVKNERPNVVFVLEGGKDALAAFELARRDGILSQVGVVMALGAAFRPITSELEQLRGRKVLLIGDRDEPGIKAVARVSQALTQLGIDHAVWNWNAFDFPGKDLFDLLAASSDREKVKSPSSSTHFFLFPSPSNGSTVQQVNGSTGQQINGSTGQQINSSTHTPDSVSGGGFNSSTHISDLVEPFVVEKRGTGNARSFALARALRGHEATTNSMLTDAEIDAVFRQWWTKSQSLLPADADQQKSLRHFYKQMRRVRYLPSDLNAAIQRARSLPLPDIPGLTDKALEIAALMRELQREAGDKSFICPVNIVEGFAALGFAEQAKRILLILERVGAITCVERGAPHVAGKPGKSSVWRYNLSTDVA